MIHQESPKPPHELLLSPGGTPREPLQEPYNEHWKEPFQGTLKEPLKEPLKGPPRKDNPKP